MTLGVPGPDVVAEVPRRARTASTSSPHSPPTRRAVFHASRRLPAVDHQRAHRSVRDVPARRRAHALGAGPVERGAGGTLATRDRARTHLARLLAALSAHDDGRPRRHGVRRLCAVRARSSPGREHDRRPASSAGALAISDAVAREHERHRRWLAAGSASCRTRWSGSPAPPGARRPADHLRLPGPAEPREGGLPDCSTRSPGRRPRRRTTAHRRRRAGATTSCRRSPARTSSSSAGSTAAEGRVPRRHRLPGRAVRVEGAGWSRGERGPGALRPGHRGAHRRDPGARSRAPRNRCCSAAGDRAELARRTASSSRAPRPRTARAVPVASASTGRSTSRP